MNIEPYFLIPQGKTYVGNSQNCQIKLVGDLIKSEHLLVQRSGDVVEIENLSGETFVNGEPISSLTRFRIEII